MNTRTRNYIQKYRGVFLSLLFALTLSTGCPNPDTPGGGGTPTATESFAVTFSAGANGTLTASVDGAAIASGDKVEKNKTVIFSATPDAGYKVDAWAGATQDTSDVNKASLVVSAAATVSLSFTHNSPQIYSLEGVSFTMKPIAAVANANIGDNVHINNAVHRVSLSAYYIGETEVTQELYKAVLQSDTTANAEPSEHNGSGPYAAEAGETQSKRPVEKISWYDAVYFCNALSKKLMSEADCVYTISDITRNETTKIITAATVTMDMGKKGFRLPTEAEWEYAAMGGSAINKWPGTDTESELTNYAWYGANAGGKTHEVKKKTANAYGLYDMSGNVIEWCWDWYTDSTPAGGPDPLGATAGASRVGRGGSFSHNADECARANRFGGSPADAVGLLGLRLVCRP